MKFSEVREILIEAYDVIHAATDEEINDELNKTEFFEVYEDFDTEPKVKVFNTIKEIESFYNIDFPKGKLANLSVGICVNMNGILIAPSWRSGLCI